MPERNTTKNPLVQWGLITTMLAMLACIYTLADKTLDVLNHAVCHDPSLMSSLAESAVEGGVFLLAVTFAGYVAHKVLENRF